MKNKLYITLLAACAVGISSCKSDIDNFMVDDTVGLLKSGLVEVEVYSGLQDPLNFYVVKAGKGFQNAEVSLSVDEEVLTAYNEAKNTDYVALPADCYTISVSSITLTNDDYRKAFVIDWNRENLEAALEADPNSVIPVRMNVSETGVLIDDDRLTALIKPSMEIPVIEFNEFGHILGLAPTRQSVAEEDIYKLLKANFIAQQDIDIELAFDPELVKEYNESHNTSYVALPEEAFKIESYHWTLKKYLNSVMCKFTFVREAIIPDEGKTQYGNYMIPLRIVSAKSGDIEYNITEGKDYLLYTIDVVAAELSKSLWSIHSTSEAADIKNDPDPATKESDYGPENLIDGDKSTLWRSVWNVKDDILPLEIVIDLGTERDIYKIGFNNPTSGSQRQNANNKSGHFEASLDGVNWDSCGTWTAKSQTTPTVEAALDQVTTARYVKFVIDEFFKPANNRTTIAEINMWGE